MIRSRFLFWLKAATLLNSRPTDLSNAKKTSVPWSPTAWPKERLSFLSPLLLHRGQGLSPPSPELHLHHRPKSSRMSNPPLCSQSETKTVHRDISSIPTQTAMTVLAAFNGRLRQLWTLHDASALCLHFLTPHCFHANIPTTLTSEETEDKS